VIPALKGAKMMPQDDPAIAQIRETRHRISERCGHDPQKLADYYIKLQKQYQMHLFYVSLNKRGQNANPKPTK
jgi:hypothetical protein